MKNLSIAFVLAIIVATTCSFKSEGTGNATVEKRSGLDVYVYATPVKAYDLVSTEKFVIAIDCNEMFTKPVKKALGKGDAIIIYPEQGKFDIIKYK